MMPDNTAYSQIIIFVYCVCFKNVLIYVKFLRITRVLRNDRIMKKFISLVLSLLVVLGTMSIGLTSANATDRDIPVIYVHGYGAQLVMKQEDGSETVVFPAFDKDKLLAQVGEQKGMIAKAFVTQDWSEFDDWIVGFIADSYKDLLCDKNGKSINEIRANVSYPDSFFEERANRYKQDVEAFTYEYDFRLDPYDQMDALRAYVEKVQAATGKQEYYMVGRCLGANLVLTYMEVYKDPNLKKVSFYIPSFRGAQPISESFSGNMEVTAEGVEQLLYRMDLGVNIEVGDLMTINDALIREIATVGVDTYGLDYVVWAINNVFSVTYKDILPRMMLSSWGTFPGYWSMVEDDYYNQSKELIFDGVKDEYSSFIKKIDYYHYTIMNRAEDIIAEAEERGTYITEVLKYDVPAFPLGSRQQELSDFTVFTTDASLGATCADAGKTLDADYLAAAEKAGNKYISPDKKIDASTGLMPDRTWYIKNSVHGDMPDDVNRLFEAIFSNENFTVFDDENFPQFMYYDYDTDVISPITDESKSFVDKWFEATDSPLRRLKPFTTWIFKVLTFLSRFLFLPPRYHTN